MTPAQWREVVKANPVFQSPGFADATRKWDTLRNKADELKLAPKEAAEFIAFGMTNGKEGKLPKQLLPQTPEI